MSRRLAAVLIIVASAASGCGHSGVRDRQDWSKATDRRLWRACHVGDHGTGVVIARDGGSLYLLANAHVVGDDDEVDVWLPVRGPRNYTHFDGEVIATSHPTKVDLALIRVDSPPPGEEFLLRLAPPLAKGERRDDAEIMVVTAPDHPLVWRGDIVERTILWGGTPDESGATTYEVQMACLFGGVQQANSGSPVFIGDDLVGLNEIHPFQATVETVGADGARDRQEVSGIGISTPSRIAGFLESAGWSRLIAKGG